MSMELQPSTTSLGCRNLDRILLPSVWVRRASSRVSSGSYPQSRTDLTPDVAKRVLMERLSLFVTRCIGACAMAPNVVINGEVMGKATEEVVMRRIESLLGD